MNSDQVEGAAKHAAGCAQRTAGEVTGSTRQQVRGAARQVEGTAQMGLGDAQQDAKNNADGLRRRDH